MTKRIGPIFQIWLQEMNFFQNMTHRINFLNLTHRIELFFWIWLTELNLFFWILTHRIELFFTVTQRIELLFLIRLEELNSFLLNTTQQIENFFYWLKEMKFFQCDSQSFFRKNDSKHFTFLKYDSRIKLFFWKTMTHRMEPFFSIWLKELNPFQHMTRRNEHFINRTFSI